MKDHPLSELFPLMPDSEMKDLAADIKQNGLRTAITLFDGKILDGRNRYRACLIAGVDPKTRNHVTGSPLRFVLSANLHRRHLNDSQRALVAAKLANLRDGETKSGASRDAPAVSQGDAAERLDVSRSSVQRAKTVLSDPKLTKEVESGKTTVKAAAKQIKDAAAPKDTPEVVRDDTGYIVPPRALPFWNRKGEIEELLGHISKARSALKKVDADGDPMFVETNLNQVIGKLNDAYTSLEVSRPYCVCYSCQGQTPKSCTLCKGRGVISKFRARTVPEEIRAIREKSCKK